MPRTGNRKIVATIFGDINFSGVVGGDPDVWKGSLQTFEMMYQKEQETSDFILHIGDIAYCKGIQHCWDQFFQQVQPIAANMPYMVCFGNHDVDPEPFGFTNRFFMPGPTTSNYQASDYFYSFDLGPVHFVGFSTELWFLPVNATVTAKQQMEWLENDLQNANLQQNRKIRPWIVLFGHRPIYCSIEKDCKVQDAEELAQILDDLLVDNGVDIAVMGHVHSMERTYPLTTNAKICGNYSNPCGTVHVTNGAAGQGVQKPTYKQPAWSAWRAHIHGYGRLIATVEELTWEFVERDHGNIVDSFTLQNANNSSSKHWSAL
jgi:hypothetical protein